MKHQKPCPIQKIENLQVFHAIGFITNCTALVNPSYSALSMYREKLLFCHLVCLVEGYNVKLTELFPIVTHFEGDLRALLLNLQFWTKNVNQIKQAFTLDNVVATIKHKGTPNLFFKTMNVHTVAKFMHGKEDETSIDLDTQFEELQDQFTLSQEFEFGFSNYAAGLQTVCKAELPKTMKHLSQYCDFVSEMDTYHQV